MVWYSHLSKNFPEFVVVHTVKGFGIVNKAEVSDVRDTEQPYAKDFDCVDHNKLWKILKDMGIPDHLTCLLKQQLELDMEQQTGSK